METHRKLIAELSHFVSWLRRLGTWFFVDVKTLWVTVIVGLVLPALVIFVFGLCERPIRIAGLLLQVGGIFTVIHGIEQTRRLFDLPKLGSWIRERLKQFPTYKRHIVGAGAVEISIAGADADAHIGQSNPPPDATTEQRIQSLEANVRYINERIDAAVKRINESLRRQTEALDQEHRERSSEDAKLSTMLERSETGGLHISAIGTFWLLFGIILSALAPDFPAC